MMLFAAIYLLRKKLAKGQDSPLPSMELVIPVRNESHTILYNVKNRLCAIQAKMPLSCTLVDDGSVPAVQHMIGDCNCRLLRIESGESGSKKKALSAAIESSNAEWIITSDADTRNSSTWPEELTLCMRPGIDFIAAPVFVSDAPHFIARFSQCESLCLWTVALGSQFIRTPLLCSGANLAFRRKAWLEIGGYASHAHIPSGDDVLLMHQLWQRNASAVNFCVSKDAACFTESAQDWNAWFGQRRRWISKTQHVQNPIKLILLLVVALWLYLPFLLACFSFQILAGFLALETVWIIFLARFYAVKLPRLAWFIFRFTYPLLLPLVFFARQGMWKAQVKS